MPGYSEKHRRQDLQKGGRNNPRSPWRKYPHVRTPENEKRFQDAREDGEKSSC